MTTNATDKLMYLIKKLQENSISDDEILELEKIIENKKFQLNEITELIEIQNEIGTNKMASSIVELKSILKDELSEKEKDLYFKFGLTICVLYFLNNKK